MLMGFRKVKILGPDMWAMEFYLEFFNLLGNEMVRVVEKSRLT